VAAGKLSRAAFLFYPPTYQKISAQSKGTENMYTSINTDMGGTTLTEQPLILSAKRCADGNGTLSYLFFSD
jgi:hypothetical protein